MARPRLVPVLFALLVAAVTWPISGQGQNSGRGAGQATPAPATAQNVEWRAYGAVEGSTRYSPLDQINRDNVKNLQVAWTWKFDNFGTPAETVTTETTPLMVNGTLYF